MTLTNRPAGRWLRLAWVAAVAVYVVPFLLGLPLLMRQYSTLTGSALTVGFQVWSSTELRAALNGAGLPVGAWTAVRLAAELLTTLGFVAMGLVIFWRRSGDRFGLFASLFLVTFGLVSSNSYQALQAEYPELVPWLSGLVSLPWLGFYVFFYTFPTGRFVPRWTAAWAPVFLLLLIVLFVFFRDTGIVVGIPLIIVAFGSALFAQVYRYARVSNPTQQAQTKWVTFAIGVIALVEFVGQGLLPVQFPALVSDPTVRLRYSLVLVLAVPMFLLVPLAVAIAILRYRLWDIDVIIRRTLIYTVLTGLLALAYFGTILVLQTLFGALTGESRNELVTVLSTLVIAALFVPLRSRVQGAIDRRFFRQKYDAARTLAGFAAAARDEVDLDRLSAQLVDVVEDAMQPEQVSLWLRKAKLPLTASNSPFRPPA